MGMKFHKFYVAVLNPLAIILIGVIAVLLLIVALSAGEVTTEGEMAAEGVDIPFFGNLEVDAVLWTLFGLAAAILLFMLITEFLLVARKKFGIILLSLSLILGISSNVIGYVRYPDDTPWYTMAISVVISALVLAYYWRRYHEFSAKSPPRL